MTNRVRQLIARLQQQPVSLDFKREVSELSMAELKDLTSRIISGEAAHPSPPVRMIDDAEYASLYEEACLVASEYSGKPEYGASAEYVFTVCWGERIAGQILRERETFKKHYRG